MPQVPRYTPQEQLKPLPTPRVDEDAFGAGVGRAMEQAGNRMMATGDMLGQNALKLYEQVDRTAAKEAYAKMLEQMRRTLHGEEGLFSRKGKNAVDVYRDGDDALREIFDTISSDLKSERQKRYFQDMAFQKLETARDQLARHQAEQLRVYEAETANALIQTSQGDAIANYTDPVAFSNAVNEGLGQIDELAASMGMSEEAAALKKEEYLSGIHVEVINQMLAKDDGKGARAWYEGNKKQITGSVRDEIENSIKNVELTVWTQEKAVEIFNKYGLNNERGALAFIEKNYSGERQDKLLSRVEAKYVDARRFRAEREAAIYDSRKNSIKQAGNLEDALKIAGDEKSLIDLANSLYGAKPLPRDEQLLLYEKTFMAIDDGKYRGEGAILQLHKDVDGKLDENMVGKLETQLKSYLRDNGKRTFDGISAVIDQFKADTDYKEGKEKKVKQLAEFRMSLDNYIMELSEVHKRDLTEKEKYEAGLDLMEIELNVDPSYAPFNQIFKGKLYEVDQSYINKAIEFLVKNKLVVNADQIAMAIEDIMLKEQEQE